MALLRGTGICQRSSHTSGLSCAWSAALVTSAKKKTKAVGEWIGRDESAHGSTDVVLSRKRNSHVGNLQCNSLQIWLFGWLDGVFCTSQKSFKRKVSKGKNEHVLWKALWQWEPIMKREEKGEGFTFRVELWVWNNCKFAGEKILCFAS